MASSSVKAVEAARARRVEAAAKRETRFQWFLNEVSDKVATSLRNRVRLATEHVRNQVVINISRPVTKTVRVYSVRNPETGRVKRQQRTIVSNRSKPGEFPKADTTQLMKTIFGDVREDGTGRIDGFVGSPLDYALFLELKMDRRFLTRTLAQERDTITRILTGPIT